MRSTVGSHVPGTRQPDALQVSALGRGNDATASGNPDGLREKIR